MGRKLANSEENTGDEACRERDDPSNEPLGNIKLTPRQVTAAIVMTLVAVLVLYAESILSPRSEWHGYFVGWRKWPWLVVVYFLIGRILTPPTKP